MLIFRAKSVSPQNQRAKIRIIFHICNSQRIFFVFFFIIPLHLPSPPPSLHLPSSPLLLLKVLCPFVAFLRQLKIFFCYKLLLSSS